MIFAKTQYSGISLMENIELMVSHMLARLIMIADFNEYIQTSVLVSALMLYWTVCMASLTH